MADPTLKAALRQQQIVIAPGVFDMISARIADRLGFGALYATGYGMVASHLGLADVGLATYSDMVARAGQFARSCRTPVIADADTGYGGLLNVRHTVRGYEAAGIAAIQIEDQESPKKCGHTPGRRVIPAQEMALKIELAVELAHQYRVPGHRAHGRAHLARPDRGNCARPTLRPRRRRYRVRGEPGDRGRNGAHRTGD